MHWVSQYSNANMVKTDFFEAKSTAYAKRTALEDDLYPIYKIILLRILNR